MFQGSDFGSIIFEISRKIHGKAFCPDFEPLSSESIQHFLKNKLHSYMFFTNLGTMVGNVSRLNCIFQYFQQGITMAKPFEVRLYNQHHCLCASPAYATWPSRQVLAQNPGSAPTWSSWYRGSPKSSLLRLPRLKASVPLSPSVTKSSWNPQFCRDMHCYAVIHNNVTLEQASQVGVTPVCPDVITMYVIVGLL